MSVPQSLDTDLGGNGKTSPRAKGFGRYLESRRGLLALVFGAIHHLNHLADQYEIITVISGDLLGRVQVFHVFVEDGVEYLVCRLLLEKKKITMSLGRGRINTDSPR